MITQWLTILVCATSWLLPHPADRFGWGLRMRLLDFSTPYLAGEGLGSASLTVTLINYSRETREYVLLEQARENGDLESTILKPDGKILGATGEGYRPVPWVDRAKLPSGRAVTSQFWINYFGYGSRLTAP